MKIRLLLVVLILPLICTAQTTIDIWGRDREIHQLTKDKIFSDINEFTDCISSNHISPFTVISRKDFFRMADSVRNAADAMNVDQLLVSLLELNAAIGDEHTNLSYRFKDRFPFTGYIFEEGYYIVRTDIKNKDLHYARVVAVNGMPIDAVLQKLKAIVPGKNPGRRKILPPATCSIPIFCMALASQVPGTISNIRRLLPMEKQPHLPLLP